MDFVQHTWALVLAAGNGSRLQGLTTSRAGVSIPKQFCSLRGGPSLLKETLDRAQRVAPRKRICTIVATQHRTWWEEPLARFPAANVIVQPRNRGTANGVLLSLLHILRHDEQARIVLLPSDHHVHEESVLADALHRALAQLNEPEQTCLFLGMEPHEPDPELGYIVPGDRSASGISKVLEFVEKPCTETARSLIARGALWNGFIVAARAVALLRMFQQRFPKTVMQMRDAIERDQGRTDRAPATQELYSRLPEIDFSRHIAQGNERELGTLRVPPCGWSDLGTPVRLAETLRRLPPLSIMAARRRTGAVLNLSTQAALAGSS